jgi:hypothetical protein
MYYYAELLRSLRALRIVAILLGLFVAASVIFRLTVMSALSPEAMIAQLRSSPTAHVTETTLPDGGTRIVIDDPAKKRHTVVVRHGNNYSAVVTAPIRRVTVDRKTNTTTERSEVIESHVHEFGPSYELGALFAMTLPMGLILVTLLAGPLAKENDGHLELAWTKPVSRERYAVTAVAIDAVTIVLAQVATAIVIVLATASWGFPGLSAGPDAAMNVGLALLAPLAMYACLTAASASLKRGPGTAIGIGWVVALVIPAVASMTANLHVPFWEALHGTFTVLSYADPVTYVWFQDAHSAVPAARSAASALTAAALLAVVYSAAAVLQWRRVEA